MVDHLRLHNLWGWQPYRFLGTYPECHREIAPKLIAKVYSLARKALINSKREIKGGIKGKWVRPRGITQRVSNLLDFVEETPSMSWDERFRAGMDKYKYNIGSYKNVHSMQVTYSRAKKRMEKRNEREIFETIG